MYLSKTETIEKTMEEMNGITNRLHKAFIEKDNNYIKYLQGLYKEMENRLKSFCDETEDKHKPSGIVKGKKGEWYFNPDY